MKLHFRSLRGCSKVSSVRRRLPQRSAPTVTRTWGSCRRTDAPWRRGTSSGDIQPVLDELERSGIILRDPARGLIDFPAMHLGRVVHLCWQLGEDDSVGGTFPTKGLRAPPAPAARRVVTVRLAHMTSGPEPAQAGAPTQTD